jgi:hypothetical protein
MKHIVDLLGNEYWYNDNGDRHREDGPAIERCNGDRFWYLNGKLHRENGAAIEYADGHKSWWINGQKINCKNNKEFLRMVKMKELL